MDKIIVSAVMLVLIGCGGSQKVGESHPESSAETAKAHEHGPECSTSCPMKVENTTVSYEDAPDGAIVVFTTTSGAVSDLQARVAKMAEMHGERAPEGKPGHVAHSARTESVELGARLILVASDPKDVDALRADVREHVEHMQRGDCPMMDGHHGQGHGHDGHHGEHPHQGGHHDEHHDQDGHHDEHGPAGGPQG